MDDLFLYTAGLIFVLTLAGAVILRVTRDRCLKLMHDHHVTYVSEGSTAVWGDMHVSSQGFEIRFDSPFVNSRGLTKTGYLVYDDDLLKTLAICRTVHGLTADERRDREKQITRSIHPKLHRRFSRSIANLLNMVRDAIVNTLSLFLGRMTGKGGFGGAVQSQSKRITELGGKVLGTVANAYEPLLETFIGKPVVMEVLFPKGSPHPSSEFSGYLVDYNERFIALFNPDQHPEEEIDVTLVETADVSGGRVEITDEAVSVRCTGRDALIVKRLVLDDQLLELTAVVLSDQHLTFHRSRVRCVQLIAERTRRLDLICPRTRARVRFSSASPPPARRDWVSVAPEVEELEGEQAS